jgi:hypothetical protein
VGSSLVLRNPCGAYNLVHAFPTPCDDVAIYSPREALYKSESREERNINPVRNSKDSFFDCCHFELAQFFEVLRYGCTKMRIRTLISRPHGWSKEQEKHMEGSPFRVRGIEVADCRGRTATLQRVRNELANNQVSIVGPRHGGKTVLMHRLAMKIDEERGQFAGSLLWNLKENRFTSDGDFLDEFRNRLVEPLRTIEAGLVKDLQADSWSTLEALQIVFEWLHNSGKCLVVCMDGFDALPIGTALTAGPLENLRSLAVKCTKSIRFVVTSRKPLRDLCASLETADSPFHNLFPDPVVLPALTRQEVEEFVAPFRDAGITIIRGADTELFNWSGGFPLLVSMLGQRLWARLNPGESLTPELVNEEGGELLNDRPDTSRTFGMIARLNKKRS